MEERLSERELQEINFMLEHLKVLDDKIDITIKASNGILALVVGVMAFMIAFVREEVGIGEILLFLIPVSSVLLSVISSILLLYPKFTQYVFFEKKMSFEEIESLYRLSLRKKSNWIRLSVFSLVLGMASFIIWFVYVLV